MIIKPVGDKVLVKIEAPSLKSEGGIVLPPSGVKQNVGIVIEVGDGLLQNGVRQPSLVNAGDKITWGGAAIGVYGTDEYVLVPELSILYKIT